MESRNETETEGQRLLKQVIDIFPIRSAADAQVGGSFHRLRQLFIAADSSLVLLRGTVFESFDHPVAGLWGERPIQGIDKTAWLELTEGGMVAHEISEW